MSANITQVPSHLSGSSDLAFKTEDGQIMTIEAFYLKASSQLIRDMLVSNDLVSHSTTTPPNTTPPAQTPIDLPFHSSVVQLYFKIVKLGPLPNLKLVSAHFPKDHPYHGAKNGGLFYSSMLDLLDFLDCAISHRERAIALFEPVFESDPWGVFCVAAKRKDVAMAKKAIANLHRLSGGDLVRIAPTMMEGSMAARLPLGWLLGHQRAVVDSQTIPRVGGRPQHATVEAITPEFWTTVASRFVVQPLVHWPNARPSNVYWNAKRAEHRFLLGFPGAKNFELGIICGIFVSLSIWGLTKPVWGIVRGTMRSLMRLPRSICAWMLGSTWGFISRLGLQGLSLLSMRS